MYNVDNTFPCVNLNKATSVFVYYVSGLCGRYL